MNTGLHQAVEISSLSHDGRGIAFYPGEGDRRGKAIFIPGALPGQKVLCQAGADHGSWQEGKLIKILDYGENQAGPICPHAHECGGCPLQIMPYDTQLAWKKKLLLDPMERIGGFDRSFLESVWKGIEPSPLQTRFRNKIELAFCHDAAKPCPGMRKRGSHEVIPIKQCSLVSEEANKIIHAFTELAQENTWPKDFWRFLVLRQDQDDQGKERWHIIAISRPSSKNEYEKVRGLADKLLRREPDLFSFIYEIRKNPARIAQGEKRIFSLGKGEDVGDLSFPLRGKIFRTDAASFFQVNSKASEKLAELVKQADTQCDKKNGLLDLYCGAGAPGLLLAPEYKKYMGMELDASAINHARKNAADLPHCSFQAGDAARLIAELPEDFAKSVSTVLTDPPRSGLDRRVIDKIMQLAPENIIMISCNPSTLARDSRLLSRDYELKSLAGADLFPHTPHVEACSLWKHK